MTYSQTWNKYVLKFACYLIEKDEERVVESDVKVSAGGQVTQVCHEVPVFDSTADIVGLDHEAGSDDLGEVFIENDIGAVGVAGARELVLR